MVQSGAFLTKTFRQYCLPRLAKSALEVQYLKVLKFTLQKVQSGAFLTKTFGQYCLPRSAKSALEVHGLLCTTETWEGLVEVLTLARGVLKVQGPFNSLQGPSLQLKHWEFW